MRDHGTCLRGVRRLESCSIGSRAHIVPRIKEAIAEQRGEMLFLTGVGACYSFLRTHQLIDENVLTVDVPVVLFFPGSYKAKADGSVPLDILNIPQGQGGGLFYRARNVYDL